MTTEERERLGKTAELAYLDAVIIEWPGGSQEFRAVPASSGPPAVAPDLAAEAEEIVRLVLCDRPDMDAWMAVGARIEELGGPPGGVVRACTEWVESRLREIAGLAPPSPDPAVATELLPCPFCGATPEVIGGDDVAWWYWVRCPTHACPSGPVNFKRREQAVAAWNRRAPLATPDLAAARLQGDAAAPLAPAAEGFEVGQLVEKIGGDYRFVGPVVARFFKLSGQLRYVVEDDRGILHIFGPTNLRPAGKARWLAP